jgi:hypothetical protein
VAGSGAAVAGAAGCEGSVCACASCVRPDEAAAAFVVPIVALQANSSSAKESWRDIGDFRSREKAEGGALISAPSG